MITSEINDSLKGIDHFIGTFPCNLIPSNIPFRPCSMVINTDNSKGGGEHWVSLILLQNSKAEYFDSFGFPPLIREIQSFINSHGSNGFTYSAKVLQHPSTSSCGLYCIEFLRWRAEGLSYQCFTNNFSDNLSLNESILKRIKGERSRHKRESNRDGQAHGVGSCERG